MDSQQALHLKQAAISDAYGALVTASRAAYAACIATGYLSDATDAHLDDYRTAERARGAFYRAHFLGIMSPLTGCGY